MQTFEQLIRSNAASIHKVVDFNPQQDHVLPLDFTSANAELSNEMLDNTDLFSVWINQQLDQHQALYGIGGYSEHRTIYSRSAHFDAEEEPRRLHLGVDIWGAAGTAVYNFYAATVHSFANNANFGDYGGTIILAYELDGFTFHALYGHLSVASLVDLSVGKQIAAGAKIAELGEKEENGHWPPHLHFQIIQDMGGFDGDYPGVCKFSEREKYLANCPDPNVILNYSFR